MAKTWKNLVADRGLFRGNTLDGADVARIRDAGYSENDLKEALNRTQENYNRGMDRNAAKSRSGHRIGNSYDNGEGESGTPYGESTSFMQTAMRGLAKRANLGIESQTNTARFDPIYGTTVPTKKDQDKRLVQVGDGRRSMWDPNGAAKRSDGQSAAAPKDKPAPAAPKAPARSPLADPAYTAASEALDRSRQALTSVENANRGITPDLIGTEAAAKYGQNQQEYVSRFGTFLDDRANLEAQESGRVARYHTDRLEATVPEPTSSDQARKDFEYYAQEMAKAVKSYV